MFLLFTSSSLFPATVSSTDSSQYLLFSSFLTPGYNVSETIRKGIFEVDCYAKEEAQLSLGYFSALIGMCITLKSMFGKSSCRRGI
jgi:hypothetical protein